MKAAVYPKLAIDGIRKNARLYIPYIFTQTGMVMMYYIITFLQYSKSLEAIPTGYRTVRETLYLGGWVISVFAAIFLFYTNSFLIRRRKKEFGLYNILGMGKRNIMRILFWESLIISAISIAAGLAAGIGLSKLAELGLINIMQAEVSYTLSVSAESVILTAKVFGVISLLLFLNTVRQISFSNAISLLKSESVGEKPPKGNMFLGIAGVLILAAAYYIAVAISDPVMAMMMFFVAVIMVIIGTYLLFISFSVLLCRLLQKNKKYYYKANHFVSVSSMVYRMKRNGAGLASICILATMVLVMISSTTSLYFGNDNMIKSRYPKEINTKIYLNSLEAMNDENLDYMRSKFSDITKAYGTVPENIADYRTVSFSGVCKNGVIKTDPENTNRIAVDSELYQICVVPFSDALGISDKIPEICNDEAVLYVYGGEYGGNKISINGGKSYTVKQQLDGFVESGDSVAGIVPTMYIIVSDFEGFINECFVGGIDFEDYYYVSLQWRYDFDINTSDDNKISISLDMMRAISDIIGENSGDTDISGYSIQSREANRQDYFSIFGGLFFIGIILSMVFIVAAVLIIYYKQISEGYEDRARFEIMQKVGMTKKEIRKSINSQLLTVFFMPLVCAGIHLAFAFPMISKVLKLFALNNVPLFLTATILSFAVFALFYTLVYAVTSSAYYKIVSGTGK